MFVWRLGRPALARFSRLRHGDRASVCSTFPAGTGQLWDDGGRLGRWTKKRTREEKFNTAAVFQMNRKFNLKKKVITRFVKVNTLMRSLTKQYKHVTLEGLTAARYRAEVPSFRRAGGVAPRSGFSTRVPAVVRLEVLLWKTD